LKEKILKNIENNLTKKNLLISFVKEMKIGILFVYVFYFLFFLIFVFGVFIPVMNQVMVVIKEGIAKVPEVIKNLKFWIENLSGKTNLPLEQNIYEIIGNLSKWLDIILSTVIKLLGNVLYNLGDWVFLILVPILGIYLIEAKKEFFNWLKDNVNGIIYNFFQTFDNYQKIYIKAILVNIFSITLLSSLLFSLFLGIEGILYGIVYGIFSFVPLIGPLVGGLPVIIVGFGKSLYLGIIFVFLAFIIQQIADNLITPRIVQKFLVINPFFSIVSILAFYGIFNFWTIFFAVPLSLSLKNMIEYFNKENDILKKGDGLSDK
ncbi:MAG: AI-2E family transporter, partial [bacterium]